jgi:hypothetical protein
MKWEAFGSYTPAKLDATGCWAGRLGAVHLHRITHHMRSAARAGRCAELSGDLSFYAGSACMDIMRLRPDF